MPSPPAFKIIVYGTQALAETPDTAKFVAGLFIGYDTAPRWFCSGPTEAAAREKMETFWGKERKSHEPRQAPKKGEPAQGVDAAPEPVSVVAEDDDEVL